MVSPATSKFLMESALFLASQVGLYYGFKWILKSMDPNRQKKDSAKLKSSIMFNRLSKTPIELTEHEQILATEVIFPDDIEVTFASIGGLEDIIESLRETVIFPLRHRELFEVTAGDLTSPPKGVLLYGPPGCGKTMLAQALAKESGATFINLHVSTLTEKWYGESQKLVHAVFSLARKLEPTIIFIDEIDSFLRERRSHDHEATSMMKAEFMALWDGLTSGHKRVMVLGATNRPDDIDKAILRRMPKRVAIELPNANSRRQILNLLLSGIKLDPKLNFEKLVKDTEGLSASDLKELCRNAAMQPVRELIRQHSDEIDQIQAGLLQARPVALRDFVLPNLTGKFNESSSSDLLGDESLSNNEKMSIFLSGIVQMQAQIHDLQQKISTMQRKP